MRRARVALPETFDYSTELAVRITDINYGMHLAAEQVLPFALEARTRFLLHLGYSLTSIEGAAPIMLDAVIMYMSQAFYGDTLRIEVAATDFSQFGFDFVCRITSTKTEEEVARVKLGTLFFDYDTQQRVPVPTAFRARFPHR
jgi:4-hydroxybenzoyl-CoA thioesterase